MHITYLVDQLLNGKWFLEPGFANSQAPIVSNLLNNYTAFEKQEPDPETAVAISPLAKAGAAKYSYRDGFDRAPSGSIAVIKLKGVLLKDDQYCGPIGTARIGEIIKAADAHGNIAGIVLHVDSPGGTVDGTEALANIVKAVQKPVVTFVDGLMASAAMWIGSCADEIIASTDTDEVGSIGVMLSFVDIQPYWESLGIKFHRLVASTSHDKNKAWEKLRQGEYDQFIKEVLNPLDEKFMAVIRENLPGIEEKHLTGNMFFARDVMGKIVDAIGTLDDAVTRCSELAQERQTYVSADTKQAAEEMHANPVSAQDSTIPAKETSATTTEENNNSKNMKQFNNVNAALGVESLESVDGVVSLNQQQLEALDTELGRDNASQIQARLDTANETIASQETTISEHEATIAGQNAEIARLKGKAVEETTTKTDGDDKDLKTDKSKTVVKDEMDFSEHVNAVASEYLPNYK